ncbi:MAG: phthiocerol/phthiodiolone dimycocerosyl transferase family protein [Segniliparus sp.]|uniref:phthiocerol/phthiodiolone dimycocerosyl transferase family protein n=1 Tax=Segniliparus sp. TaxID=2804064 RepID=UPI003F2AED4E
MSAPIGPTTPLGAWRMLSAAESELNHLRRYTTIWYMARLHGELDVDALATAATTLQQKYPDLASRVEPVGRGFRVVAERANGSVVSQQAEPLHDFAALPVLSQGDGTLSIRIHPGEAGNVVAFGVDHSIADARLSYAYFCELWEIYTQIVSTGSIPRVAPQPAPDAPETAMAKRGVRETPLPEKPWLAPTSWGGKQQSEISGAPGTVLGWQHCFDPEASAALLAAARRRETTVNTLLTGVIALAERALFPGPDNAAVNLGFESLVDYRGHLTPPAKLAEIANGIMISRSQVRVRADDDPVRIGREVTRQIKDDLRSGFLAQSVRHIADVLLTGRFGPFIRITNPGVLPAPPLPESLVMHGLDAFLTTAQTPRPTAPDGSALPHASRYEVYSFAGELSIFCKFPTGSLAPEQVASLRANVVGGIEALATG